MKNSRLNVLFIRQDEYQYDPPFPLGIGYLAAVSERAGANVSIYNQDLFRYSDDHLKNHLQHNEYDLICMGFLAPRLHIKILDLCRIINNHKKHAWFVLGGHGPSPIPEYVLRLTKADIVAIGEAEDTFSELIGAGMDREKLKDIDGIAFWDNNEITINKRRDPIKNLDSIPFPAWHLFPMEEYTSRPSPVGKEPHEKVGHMILSRGCVGRCNFCYRMEKGFRYRSIQNILEEIIELREKYNVTYYVFNDELALYPKKRIFELKDALDKNDIKIKFQASTRAELFNENGREIASLLKEMGCCYLGIGFESANQDILNTMGKRTTVAQNHQAAQCVTSAKIPLGLFFIWGNIGDNEQTLREDVDFIKQYNTYNDIRTIRPPTPYPGAPLYDYAIEKKLLTGPDDFFNKYTNGDLLTVNFTEIENARYYEALLAANRELIYDYYDHTTRDYDEAESLVQTYSGLYSGTIDAKFFFGHRNVYPKENENCPDKE